MIVTPAKPATTTTNVIITYLNMAAENLLTSLFETGAKRMESERLTVRPPTTHVRLDQAQLHIPGQRESTLSLQGNGSSNSGIRSDRLVTLPQR